MYKTADKHSLKVSWLGKTRKRNRLEQTKEIHETERGILYQQKKNMSKNWRNVNSAF